MSGIDISAIHRARMAALDMAGTMRPAAPQAPPAVSFGDSLKQMLGEVSAADMEGRRATEAFLRGEPVEMHQVMAAAEEAGIAVELLVEVRNKLIEAYRTLTNLQS
jgi:flagellar hook-basal body complex protein FliE